MLPEEADLIDSSRFLRGTNSPNESEETFNIICEGQTQATDAANAPDTSVDEVIHHDDPP